MGSAARTGGTGAACAFVALLVVLLAPASASAVAENISAVRFTCGHDPDPNTMRPTITVVRDHSEGTDRRGPVVVPA